MDHGSTPSDDARPDTLPDEIDAPTRRALLGAGYTSLEDLSHATEEDILPLHGIGPKVVEKLRDLLAASGRSFADDR